MLRKLLAGALAVALMGAAPAAAATKFQVFIQTLWPLAKKAGASRALFDRAFAGVSEPDPDVLRLAANQPEFTSTTSGYLEKAVTPARIASGREEITADGKLLAAIESKYGVDRHVLLGIWGIESNFGKDKGSMKVVRSLATLIYAGNKKQYAREQLVAAFRILRQGVVKPENFTGSWAAALGHTQFIPTSYLSYAVDWTGDGVKDIWNSKEDALASTANYLAKAGWKSDRPWGWEVTLPQDFNPALIGRATWKTVAEWQKLGVVPARGNTFTAPDAKAFIMVPQGVDGPRFLVTQNFLALMDYNLSHSYAIAVGNLGDRIAGHGVIVAPWPDTRYDLSYRERVDLQRRLTAKGFDTGGDDGRFGARTFEAVIAYEKSVGLPIDGKPSKKVLLRLRQGK